MNFIIFLTISFSLNGFAQSYWRIGTEGRANFSWIQNTLNAKIQENIKDRVVLYGEAELDYLGFPGVKDFNDLLRQERINPFRIVDREIYVQFPKVFGFIDIKMGDLIEKWGTADTFNPTDLINPYNLEDPLEFGESIPVPAIRVRIPFGDLFTLTGLYIPLFRPAQLPLSSLKAGVEATPLPSGIYDLIEDIKKIPGLNVNMEEIFRSVEKIPVLPDSSPRNSAFALKAGGLLGGFDWSISFYHGREDMPLPATGSFVMNYEEGRFFLKEGKIFLVYPEINAIGFDTSTSIPFLDIGFWFEGAVIFPSSITQEINVEGVWVNPLSFKEERLKSPYFKFTAGIDYTFKGGFYTNIQFVRGFFDEIGNEMIKNYIFAGFQDQILSDRIRYRLFGGYTIDDNSFVIYPEIGFMPYEEGEIVVGGYILTGSKESKFGQPGAGGDQVFLKFKASF